VTREEEADDFLIFPKEMEHELITEVIELIGEGHELVALGDPSLLSQDINSDLHIMNVEAIDIVESHVPLRAVEPLDTSDFTGLYPLEN